MSFERERRYIVLKISDAEQALSNDDWTDLERIQDRIDFLRKQRGKGDLLSVVVESDWPEYEPTWAAIESRMAGN